MFSQFRTSSVGTSSSRSGDGERLHQRWFFLTYSQCSVEEKEKFEAGFLAMLERNELRTATYYGCREHHVDEGIHYHVLVNLGQQVNWSFKTARSRFVVEGNECESLRISTPWPKQRRPQFIENRINYCEKEKGGDCFGQRPTISSEKVAERKRKCEEIGMQPNMVAKLAKLKEEFPDAFYVCFDEQDLHLV